MFRHTEVSRMGKEREAWPIQMVIALVEHVDGRNGDYFANKTCRGRARYWSNR